MGVISKPCCHCGSCFASDDAAKKSANFSAPSSGFSFQSTAAVLSSVPPVHCPLGTASGLNSAAMREKAPMPAPNCFTFGEIATASGSNSAVMHEKASVPAPNRFTFGVSPTVDGSNSAVMSEKASTPALNRFTFGEIPTAGRSNFAVIPEKASTPAPNRFTFGEFPTAGRSNYAVIPEKASTPAPNRFTFGEIPTAGRSNSAVMPEKAPTPAPNCFTLSVSPTAGGSNSAVMPEKTSTPAPNHFTFSVSPIVGGSNSAVMPEKTPTPAPNRFTFGVSPTVGGLEQQDWGKSKCTGTFESAAPVPSLFSMSATPALHSASHSLFHQTPKGPSFGDLFQANTTTPIPSSFAASGQYPAVKGSCTHGPPTNNLFANTLESILQNHLSKLAPSILNRQFPKPTSLFPPPAEIPLQNQIAFVNAPACTTAPSFSWTTLPGFSASSTGENCRKERIFPFAPTRFLSDGPFAVLHSISAFYKGSSHEELRWEHYQNNPMLGKVPVMMLPVIPLAGGGFAILTVPSNLAQPSTIHQATEGGASLTFPSGYKS